MLVALRVGNAFIFQPPIQLGQARDPRLGTEQQIAQGAALCANDNETSTPRKFTLEGDR
jgi:hypothetical protein